MFFFTIRRVLASVLVLLVSSFLVFALCAASFDPLSKYYNLNPRPPAATAPGTPGGRGASGPLVTPSSRADDLPVADLARTRQTLRRRTRRRFDALVVPTGRLPLSA